MEHINNMINSRSSDDDLDGRRPTAGGMPSNDEGTAYTWGYVKCLAYYKHDIYNRSASWWKERILIDSDRWHYHYDRSLHRVPPPGWSEALHEIYYQQRDREDAREKVSEAREKLSRELGPREFTLTYSPAWYADDESAKDAMRVAIDKLTRYYKDEIIEFHAIGEYTEAGRAHIHCYYELDGGNKITDKNFKRAWSHWDPRKKLGSGHQGGHHANIRSKSDFLGYIEKDLDTAWMNVHITNANDNQTSQREGHSQELSQSRRDDDSSEDDC